MGQLAAVMRVVNDDGCELACIAHSVNTRNGAFKSEDQLPLCKDGCLTSKQQLRGSEDVGSDLWPIHHLCSGNLSLRPFIIRLSFTPHELQAPLKSIDGNTCK